MITIKRKEFIKFLGILNEMRSSHSSSYIENAGEEDNTPVDASQKMGALQLTSELPDLTDPEWEPSSTPELRDALIAISKEVPKSKLDDFYKRVMNAFEKTIDNMDEEENPFNPKNLAEALSYIFENNDEESEDKKEADEEEELKKQIEKEMEEDDPDIEDYYDEQLASIAHIETGSENPYDIEPEAGDLPSFEDIVKRSGSMPVPVEDDEDDLDDLMSSMFGDEFSSLLSDEEDAKPETVSTPSEEFDFENMDFDDLFDLLNGDEDVPEAAASIGDSDLNDFPDIQTGYNPAIEMEASFGELLVVIKKFIIARRIELYNKAFKPERFKEFASAEGVDQDIESNEKWSGNIEADLDRYFSLKSGKSEEGKEERKKRNKAFNKVFKRISSEYLTDELIPDQIVLDARIPDFLHDIAVLTDFPRNIEDPSIARELALKGIKKIISSVGNSSALEKIEKSAKEKAKERAEARLGGDTSNLTRVKNAINAEMVNQYNEVIKSLMPKEYVPDREKDAKIAKSMNISLKAYQDKKSYVTQVAGGQRDSMQNAAVLFYLRMAKAAYYEYIRVKGPQVEKNEDTNVSIDKETGRKRIRAKVRGANARTESKGGSIFMIDMSLGNSHPFQRVINEFVSNWINSNIVAYTSTEIYMDMQEAFTNEDGTVNPAKTLGAARNISKKSFAEMSEIEAFIWSNTYYHIHESLRNLTTKVTPPKPGSNAASLSKYITPSYSSKRPVFDPKSTNVKWPLIKSSDSDSINTVMEGIDLEVFDAVLGYITELSQKSVPFITIVSDRDDSGKPIEEAHIPTVAICYLAPFILAKMWQKELSDHWESYKREKRVEESPETLQGTIRDLEVALEKEQAFLKNEAMFAGASGPSGVSKMVREYINQRYALMKFAYQGAGNPGGQAYLRSLSSLFTLTAQNLQEFFETLLKSSSSAIEKSDVTEDERSFFEDLQNEINPILNDLGSILEILNDYDTFDDEELEDDPYDLLSAINDVELGEKQYTSVKERLDYLFSSTTAGYLIREITHNSMPKSTKKSQSFLPDLSQMMRNVISILIVNHPSFSLPGRQNPNPVMKKLMANQFIEQFLGFKKSQARDIRNLTSSVKGAMKMGSKSIAQSFISHGIDAMVYEKIEECTTRIYDVVFAIVLSDPRNYKKLKIDLTSILSGLNGYSGQNLQTAKTEIENELKKLKPSSIYTMATNRIQMIKTATTDRQVFDPMVDFISDQIAIADAGREIFELKRKYARILDIEIDRYCDENDVKKEDLEPDVIKSLEQPILKKRNELALKAKELNDFISQTEKTMKRPLDMVKA